MSGIPLKSFARKSHSLNIRVLCTASNTIKEKLSIQRKKRIILIVEDVDCFDHFEQRFSRSMTTRWSSFGGISNEYRPQCNIFFISKRFGYPSIRPRVRSNTAKFKFGKNQF